MARFVKKIGQGQSRYIFELYVHQVDLRVPYEVAVGAVFRQGNKRMESKKEPIVTADSSVADFGDEKLTLVASIYRDKASG